MYNEIHTSTRTSKLIPFFSRKSYVPAAATLSTLNAALVAAGLTGDIVLTSVHKSGDGLTLGYTVSWQNQATYNAFVAANKSAIDALDIHRLTYNNAVGNVHVVTFTTE